MVKRSDILSLWKSCLTVLGLFLLAVCLLVVPDSCKNKAKNGVQQRQEEQGNPKKAEFVEDLELADFSFSDISGFFLGEINDQPYALCIETADKSKVTGKYYRIDTLESSVAPIRFKLLRETNGHRLVAGSANDPITFSISADSSAILGTITTQGKQAKTLRISFKYHAAPACREIKSTRYREPKYDFTKTSDVKYGTAKGFWTSYPMENDINFKRLSFANNFSPTSTAVSRYASISSTIAPSAISTQVRRLVTRMWSTRSALRTIIELPNKRRRDYATQISPLHYLL